MALLQSVCFLLPFLCNNEGFIAPDIQRITDPVDHAEVPAWDHRKNILFFTDVHTGRIFSYNFNTKDLNSITIGGNVNPVIPVKNNSNLLVVGLNRSLVAIEWDGTNKLGKTKVISTVSAKYANSSFNEGKADKTGCLWVGTLGAQNVTSGEVAPNQGFLYSFTKDTLNDPEVHIAPVNISNGLVWNAKNDKFYYVDSGSPLIIEYDFNQTVGAISNPRVIFDLDQHPELIGIADGMTIDENDNLWVALYGGGSVIQISTKTGELLRRIAVPARDVTSAIWGGPNLDVLFVTTSRILLSADERRSQPEAGSVFAITNLNTKGRHEYLADVIDEI